MKRSVGVTSASVVLLIGSALMLLISAAAVFAAVLKLSVTRGPLGPAMVAMGGAFYLAMAGWGAGTAVGLFRLRNWARVSVLTLSVLALAFCTIILASFLMVFTRVRGPNPQVAKAMLESMVGSCAVPMAISVWWLLLFTRTGVRQQFASATVKVHGSQAPGRRPLSISVIAIFLMVDAPARLWQLFLTMPTRAMHIPVILMGALISGWWATAFTSILILASLTLGIGLWRLKPWARTGAIVYSIFTMVNVISFVLRPASLDRMVMALTRTDAAFGLSQQRLPHSFFWIVALPGLAPAAFALWFLFKRKSAFDSPVTHASSGSIA